MRTSDQCYHSRQSGRCTGELGAQCNQHKQDGETGSRSSYQLRFKEDWTINGRKVWTIRDLGRSKKKGHAASARASSVWNSRILMVGIGWEESSQWRCKTESGKDWSCTSWRSRRCWDKPWWGGTEATAGDRTGSFGWRFGTEDNKTMESHCSTSRRWLEAGCV